jgi:hypothetical protein
VANEINIDELQIEIGASSTSAEKSIDKLVSAIDKLQEATSRCTGLTKIKNQLNKLAEISEKIQNLSFGTGKISALVNEVNALNSVSVPNLNSFEKQIETLRTAASSLESMPNVSDNISELVNAVMPLTTLGEVNINSFVNSVSRLPTVAEELNAMNFDSFANDMNRVTAAVTPLASAMSQLSSSYLSLPVNIQRVVSENAELLTSYTRLPASMQQVENENTKIANSSTQVSTAATKINTALTKVKARMLAVVYAASRLSSALADCLESSNEYVENLNLFTVAMGDAAESALDYAEAVNEALGIDTSEWIQNQGVFKQITTGFGVVEEKANLMSKNLTQLGYDISSFFNIDTDEAMQKLQSGISGELEPLRRLGYALDAATLQQVAYKNGIQQNINTMTQAQKSQLRYLAIMEQSTNAMGDMARTIVTPANSMRILTQQFNQLKRAVGNIVSVFAVKLIPYLQVAIRLLTDLANELAKYWGFELPDIDYSSTGLSSATDDMDDYATSADDAADAVADTVKEVQRLAGFDEINVLQSDTTTSSGTSTSTDTSATDTSNWDVDLPEYDFLSGLDKQTDELYKKAKKKLDEIIKKFKSLRDWIKKNTSTIKTLAKVMAGLWALSKIAKFITKLGGVVEAWGKIKKAIGELKIIKTVKGWLSNFLDGFKNSTATSFFGKLKDGVTSFRNSLTKTQKLLGSLVGAGLAGLGSYNFFESLTSDTLTWKKALGDVALVLGGFSLAWIFGGGPGLALAAVATAFGAIYGAAKGAKKKADEALQAALDSEWQTAGTNITDVATSIEDYCSKLTEAESTFNDATDSLSAIGDSAQDSYDKVKTLIKGLSSDDWDTEKMTEVQDAYKDLADNTKSYADTAVSNLRNFVNANADFVTAVGGDVDALNDILDSASDNINTRIDELTEQISELLSKGTLTSEDQDKLTELTDELATLSGVDMGPSASTYEKLSEEVEALSSTDINLENLDTTQTALGEIGSSIHETLSELDTAKQNIEDQITYLQAASGMSDEEAETLRSTLTKVFDLKEKDVQEIAKGLEPINDAVENVITQMKSDIKGGYLESFGTFMLDTKVVGSLFGKSGTGKRAKAAIQKKIKETLEEYGLSGGAENLIKNSLLQGGMTASDYERLFNADAAETAAETYSEKISNLMQNTYGTTLQEYLDSVYKDSGNAYVDNMIKSIKEEVTSAETQEEYETAMEKLSSFAKAAGVDAGDDYANGVTGKLTSESVTSAMATAVGDMLPDSLDYDIDIDLTSSGENAAATLSSGFKTGIKNLPSTWNTFLGGFESFEIAFMNTYNDAVPSLKTIQDGLKAAADPASVTAIKSIDFTTKNRRVTGYATGGFPKKADLFYANEDGKSELVGRIGSQTAVANNDQITTAIATAVYKAIKNASSDGGSGDGDIYITVPTYVDGNMVGEQQYAYNKRQAVRSNGKR